MNFQTFDRKFQRTEQFVIKNILKLYVGTEYYDYFYITIFKNFSYMKCALQRKTKCTGRGKLYDGEKEVAVLEGHIESCSFNEDAAKQRSALAKEAKDNPENPLKIFQKTRNE